MCTHLNKKKQKKQFCIWKKSEHQVEGASNQLFVCLFVGVDTRLKFTIEPSLGKNGFQQVRGDDTLPIY